MRMRSIKPGRGPSMMGGVVGIFMIGFGIVWTVLAAQASGIFALFGILWTGVAIVNTVYNFKNAKGKNRYSTFDIVDSEEEPDPLNERYGVRSEPKPKDGKFCPYCGTAIDSDYSFCPSCGRKLPE